MKAQTKHVMEIADLEYGFLDFDYDEFEYDDYCDCCDCCGCSTRGVEPTRVVIGASLEGESLRVAVYLDEDEQMEFEALLEVATVGVELS
jgi:hypothetical protein